MSKFLLAFGGWIGVEQRVPSAHDGGPGDEALVEGGLVDLAATLEVSIEDLVRSGLVVIQQLAVPNGGGEIPFDGPGECVLPIGPEQAHGGVHEVSQMGIAVKWLMGQRAENFDGITKVVAEQLNGGGGEPLPLC